MAKQSAAKKLWRIGEVSRLTGIQPHILRYWEAELEILAPNRGLSTQRFYRQADIDLILTIKRLLDEEKYTLQGVKQYLTERRAGRGEAGPAAAAPNPATPPAESMVRLVREELGEILAVLDGKKPGV